MLDRLMPITLQTFDELEAEIMSRIQPQSQITTSEHFSVQDLVRIKWDIKSSSRLRASAETSPILRTK